MKGLEISRRFFFEWGLPYLKSEFPDLLDRVAAGRVGGSDIIGADDRWSRDHDWGPRFNLLLTAKDHQRHGNKLAKEINAAAPKKFAGHRHHSFGTAKSPVDVESIRSCTRFHTGRTHPPQNAREWFLRRTRRGSVVEHESWLYFFKHGPVFYDPFGEFTARKQAFSRYPTDVRLRLVANLCLGIWYAGEVKFCKRHVRRRDPVAILLCLGQFARDVMRLCFLLNDDYAPHKVWIHHEFKKLPEARGLDSKLRRLVKAADLTEQQETVLGICAYLRKRLKRAGLVESDKPGYGLRCREIEARIKDKWIRQM